MGDSNVDRQHPMPMLMARPHLQPPTFAGSMAETIAFSRPLGHAEIPKPTANFARMVAMWLLEARCPAISFRC